MAMAYNITAVTLVKGSHGTVRSLNVIVAGSSAGSVNDSATTGGASISNQTAAIPNAVGSTIIDRVCINGIVVTPGTGQTVAIEYF